MTTSIGDTAEHGTADGMEIIGDIPAGMTHGIMVTPDITTRGTAVIRDITDTLIMEGIMDTDIGTGTTTGTVRARNGRVETQSTGEDTREAQAAVL